MSKQHIILSTIGLGLLTWGGGCPTDVPTKDKPSAPSSLSVTSLSSTSLILQWQHFSATKYEVERRATGGAFAKIATVSGAYFTDFGLNSTSTYEYRVRAFNDSLAGPYSDTVLVGYTLSVALLATLVDPGSSQLAIDSTGSFLVSGGLAPGFSIWNTANWSFQKPANPTGFTSHVAISRNSALTISEEHALPSVQWYSRINVWNSIGVTLVRTIILDTTLNANVVSLRLDPQDTRLIEADNRGRIRLWDLSNGNLVQSLEPASTRTWELATASSRDLMVAATFDLLKVWQLNPLVAIDSIAGSFWRPFLNNSGTILLVNKSGNATYYRTSDWTPLYSLGYQTEAAAFSPNDSLSVVAYQNLARIMSVSTGTVYQTISAHPGPIRSIVFLPSGQQFLTTAENQTKIWSLSPILQWTIIH